MKKLFLVLFILMFSIFGFSHFMSNEDMTLRGEVNVIVYQWIYAELNSVDTLIFDTYGKPFAGSDGFGETLGSLTVFSNSDVNVDLSIDPDDTNQSLLDAITGVALVEDGELVKSSDTKNVLISVERKDIVKFPTFEVRSTFYIPEDFVPSKDMKLFYIVTISPMCKF